ncbi:MAG: 2-phospho-L-lactate transferase CofD family protein, partial [Acidimicrobiia bacterium]
LATHIFRTERMRAGATLSEVTTEITRAWGLEVLLIPMTNEPVRTRITVRGPAGEPRELAMQEWFVRDRTEPEVLGVDFAGVDVARPAPGVLDALHTADTVLICPSNPVISIGPILAVPGVRDALRSRRDRVVAVSPIVGGAPVKGPADRLMRPLGIDVSCVGVAHAYAEFCGTLVIDAVDAAHAPAVEAVGVHAVVADTMMRSPEIAADLARHALASVA